MDVAGSPCQVHAVDYVSHTLRNTASRSRSCRVDLLQHSAVECEKLLHERNSMWCCLKSCFQVTNTDVRDYEKT